MNPTTDQNELQTEPEYIESSLFPVAFRIFLSLFLLDTVLVLVILLLLSLGARPDSTLSLSAALLIVWGVHTGLFFLIAFLTLFVFLRWGMMRVRVDGHDHLLIRSGVIHTDEQMYELRQLRQLSIHQSWLGRLFGYGDVLLEFGELGFGGTVRLREVRDPVHYEKFFERYLVSQGGG